MKNERNVRSSRPRRRKLSKQFLTLLSVVLVLSALVGGTVAYLTAQSSEVENTFTPGVVDCVVSETKDGYVVQNTGNTAAMIRIAVVVNSIDENGNIYYMNPGFTVSGLGDVSSDGYYYYPSSVAALDKTGEFTVKVTSPVDGYDTQVEILAQAIQAEGRTGTWGEAPTN